MLVLGAKRKEVECYGKDGYLADGECAKELGLALNIGTCPGTVTEEDGDMLDSCRRPHPQALVPPDA